MKYWLHRISHLQNISYPLLKNGYLSIGFSDFATKEFITNVSENDWDYFSKEFDKIWGNQPRSRFSLWRFVAKMKKGDWVVVPSWETFSIYEIQDDYAILPSFIQENMKVVDWNGKKILNGKSNLFILEGETKELDLWFLRKVKLIDENISRAEYADAALTSRMKIRNTNADINDLEKSIRKALESYKKKRPINLKSSLYELSEEIRLKTILSELNENKFEHLVKLYFKTVGSTETNIPGKNDPDKAGDVDIIAIDLFDNP